MCKPFKMGKNAIFRVFMKSPRAAGWSKRPLFLLFWYKQRFMMGKIVKNAKIKKHEKVAAVPRQELAEFLFFFVAKKCLGRFQFTFSRFLLFSHVFFEKKPLFENSKKKPEIFRKKCQKNFSYRISRDRFGRKILPQCRIHVEIYAKKG